jgi:alkanesulfonate monooxygenase SsuD/methylene tetrahydromethanopterin reductase-like flavin-dependent oxidoreductase (luciferase family)
MRIGLYIRLYGRPGGATPAPTWADIREQALAAEAAGFDILVLEDALWMPDDAGSLGLWESVSVAAALAAATSTIGIGHAVINSPYRNPGLVAKIAETLDEISGGRYTLGIGLGNTPDDYGPFGFADDRRYSRFAEAIHIIHGLLRDGRVDFEGEFYRAPGAELVLRGPRPAGPPIAIAAAKPKMLRLAARYGDEWNWWTGDPGDPGALRPIVDELGRACEEVGRDPATLRRSIDVFSVAAPSDGADTSALAAEGVLGGPPEAVAERLLAYRDLGFEEVRCNPTFAPGIRTAEAIAGMTDVVRLVQAG